MKKDECTAEEWAAYIAEVRAKIALQRRFATLLVKVHRRLYGDTMPIVLVEWFDPQAEWYNPMRPFHGIMIAPCTFRAGKYQATYFDADGFSGHTIFNTQEEAVQQEYRQGQLIDYRILDRLGLDARFQRGNAWALAREALWNRKDISDLEKYAAERELHARFYPNGDRRGFVNSAERDTNP